MASWHPATTALAAISMFGASVAMAGPAGAQIDPCAHITDPFRAQHCYAAQQGDAAVRDYLQSLTPRQRSLVSGTNALIEEHVQRNGRLPEISPQSPFVSEVFRRLHVAPAEQQFVYQHMTSSVRGRQEMQALDNEICRAARAQGFRLPDCP